MSDKGDKDDDKKQTHSEIKNGVEKLIKIDKKHANFEFIDPILNLKVKVRNINSSTSTSILGQNQPENTLRCFWRHINRYYFRKLDFNEMERLSYLDQLYTFRQDATLCKQKYANHMIYTAFQEVFDKEKYLNQNQSSSPPEVQKILYKIIKASCNIQALIIECHFKEKANNSFLEQIIKEREQLYSKKSTKKKTLTDLQAEYQKLKTLQDKLLQKVESNEEQVESKSNKKKNGYHKKGSTQIEEDQDESNSDNDESTYSNDEISYYSKHSSRTLEIEMQRLSKHLDEVNHSNKQSYKKLSQKIQIENKEGKLIFFENQNDSSSTIQNGKYQSQQLALQVSKQKKKNKNNNEYSTDHTDVNPADYLSKFGGFQKELGKDPRTKMTDKEISDLHLSYLQQLIFTLEEKQVADSISKLTNCKKLSKKDYSYEVLFEDALNSQPYYIDEQTLIRFNDYREHSIFKQYNLPTKTLFSSTSHNYVQLEQFVTERNKLNPYKDCDIGEAMKKNSHMHHDLAHNKILNQTRNFDICHHCRQIFDLGYLVKCNYRSSVMGMPSSSNQSNNDQIFISQLVEYDSNQRRPFLNRKRNNYNSYIKKSNGELVCKRKFCLHCLKQNYDYKHENQSKTDWVCPFCQGYCHCIRCLRNEMINKLKGIYLLYGGDIQYLEQESLLNKYLRPLSEDDKKRKEREDISNRATNSSIIAHLVQKETYEKELKMEKDLQSQLDDLTDVRFDMERVRLVISQVCRREKLKHLRLQEDQESFDKKQVTVQKQLKKNAAKQAKIETTTTKKLTSTKYTNGVSKVKSKKVDPKSKENRFKMAQKNKKAREDDEDESQEVEEEQSNEDAESQSSEVEQEEQEEVDEEQEQDEEIDADDEEQEIEDNSDVEEDEEENSQSEQDFDEEVEDSSSSQIKKKVKSQSSDDDDDDDENQSDDGEEQNESVTHSNVDDDDDDDDDEEVDHSDESEDQQGSDQSVNQDDDQEEEEEEEEEQEEDNKKKKYQKNKEKAALKLKKISIKSRKIKSLISKSKEKTKKSELKNNKNKKFIKALMNGKTKVEDKKKKQKQQKIKEKAKKVKLSDSKFIKRTKKSSISQNNNKSVNLNSSFSKEIKNLIRNQDPTILQLTSSKEKALRSNMIPTESNHEHKHKNHSGKNGIVVKHNKNNKQNISKFEQTPKKKFKC